MRIELTFLLSPRDPAKESQPSDLRGDVLSGVFGLTRALGTDACDCDDRFVAPMLGAFSGDPRPISQKRRFAIKIDMQQN
jgi:hypothetical protein